MHGRPSTPGDSRRGGNSTAEAAMTMLRSTRDIGGGEALSDVIDINAMWDLRRKLDREDALEQVRSRQPLLLIGGTRGALAQTQFVNQLYRLQAQAGRFFLREHPRGASPWALQELRTLEGTDYGCLDEFMDQGCRASTNSREVAAELQRCVTSSKPTSTMRCSTAPGISQGALVLHRAMQRGIEEERRNQRQQVKAICKVDAKTYVHDDMVDEITAAQLNTCMRQLSWRIAKVDN